MAFSPDGRLVAATILQPRKDWTDGSVVKGLSVIETVSGEQVYRLERGGFQYVAFARDSLSLIVADNKHLGIWDTTVGARLHRMAWPESVRNVRGKTKIRSLAALPGGRAATGMSDGDILIWDLAVSTWPKRKPVGDLSREGLAALWTDLAGKAPLAYRAITKLVSAPPHAVPFLKDHIRPATVDAKRIKKLLADLDGDSFAEREAASRELARMRFEADSLLRQMLENKPSLETRRRLLTILAEPKRPPTETLRTLRAIAALERIGTSEAKRVLEKLSEGAMSLETREAKRALQRLNRR
jgi:hypothetical protein